MDPGQDHPASGVGGRGEPRERKSRRGESRGDSTYPTLPTVFPHPSHTQGLVAFSDSPSSPSGTHTQGSHITATEDSTHAGVPLGPAAQVHHPSGPGGPSWGFYLKNRNL